MPTRLSDEVSRARDGIGESNRNNRRKVRSPCPYRSGFTLVELLTTIGIIAIVAAILFPVFAKARESARRATCMSNLRQIGVAIGMYVSDNDSSYPAATTDVFKKSGDPETGGLTWRTLILPYLIGIDRQFPACPDRALKGALIAWAPSSLFSGYAYNLTLSSEIRQDKSSWEQPARHSTFSLTGTSESMASFPSLIVEVDEARCGIVAAGFPGDSLDPNKYGIVSLPQFKEAIDAQPPGSRRHIGGSNYLFTDGHVRWYIPSAVLRKPKCDGIHPGLGI